MSDEWEAPKPWPTNEEVREIIAVILKRIDETPDWRPKP